MSRYSNFINKLSQQDMTMLTPEQDFDTTGRLSFRCPRDHVQEITGTAFGNKTAPKNMSRLRSLCSDCNKILVKQDEIQPVMERLGFRFLRLDSYEHGFIVRYACACGNESATDYRNLTKEGRGSRCPRCQNNESRTPYEDILKEFTERGCVLLTDPREYTNNKQKLRFRCVCGNESEIIRSDLRRGRLCENCRSSRRVETCLEAYGTDNVSKNEGIKARITDTMTERHGVPYAQQKDSIRAKTDATSFERYGMKRAFLLPETFRKIRETHLAKHGVEYPLQSPDIQDKISAVFMKKYGVSRPVQNPEQFRSLSCFRKKPYITADGKTYMVMGYEDTVLAEVLRDTAHVVHAGDDPEIPVFDYVGDDGKDHVYYPDIFVPGENRVIEVKSVYTYNLDPRKNLAKALRVSEDCLFELWVLTDKKRVSEIVECRNHMLYSRRGGGSFVLGEPLVEKTSS